jgi:hypothetical protein
MGQSFVLNGDPMAAKGRDGSFQVNGVPEDDGSDDEVQPACPTALAFEPAIAQIALPIEENRAGQGVPRFAFIQANLDMPA